MKANLRGRIREFLTSEEGKVSAKAPLSLGVVSGSVLLAQMLLSLPADAGIECTSDTDCNEGESCQFWLEKVNEGTYEWHSSCS